MEWRAPGAAKRDGAGGTHDRALNLQQPTHHITLRPDTHGSPGTSARDLWHELIFQSEI